MKPDLYPARGRGYCICNNQVVTSFYSARRQPDMSIQRHGWVTTAGLIVILFVGLFTIVELPLQTIAIIAAVMGLIGVWILDIVVAIVNNIRSGRRSLTDAFPYIIDRRTPSTATISSRTVVLVAVLVVTSVTVGTGIGVLDTATPSVAVAPLVTSITETASGPERPPNKAAVGGSFGTITLHNDSREITLNVEETNSINGVIIIGPDRERIATAGVEVGTRQLTLQSEVANENGTYEILGVERQQGQENAPLPELEEAESHTVQLNVSE